MNNKRVKSGYDVEINLGGEFFKNIISAAFDAKKIPNEIIDGQNKIEIKKPKNAFITYNVEGADLEIVTDVEYNGLQLYDVEIYLSLKLTKNKLAIEYVCLGEAMQTLLNGFGILGKINKKLKKAIKQKIDLKMISNKVDKFEIVKVRGGGGYENAIALLLNLKIKINSQSQRPEKKYIPRGNKNDAISILPKKHSFYIGVSKESFSRFANNAWHSMGEEIEYTIPFTDKKEKLWVHPIKDGEETVGHFDSLTIKPKKGYIELKMKGVVVIDWWPDADIEVVFHITPKIVKEKLNVDVKLVKFDADTGILGDILGFIVGGILGAIIGFFTGGPVGAAVGGGIGAVGGVATVEITESVLESSFSDKIEDKAKEANIFDIFSSLPLKIKLFTDSSDNFFDKEFYLENYFTGLKCNTDGLSFGGGTKVTTAIKLFYLKIKKIYFNSASEFKKYQGIEKIKYEIQREDDKKITETLEIAEVLKRVKNGQIKKSPLDPQKVNRQKTVVKFIKFKYNIILNIDQATFLQKKGVSYVARYGFVEPKNAHSYFRGQADNRLDNNFENLPKFDLK